MVGAKIGRARMAGGQDRQCSETGLGGTQLNRVAWALIDTVTLFLFWRRQKSLAKFYRDERVEVGMTTQLSFDVTFALKEVVRAGQEQMDGVVVMVLMDSSRQSSDVRTVKWTRLPDALDMGVREKEEPSGCIPEQIRQGLRSGHSFEGQVMHPSWTLFEINHVKQDSSQV